MELQNNSEKRMFISILSKIHAEVEMLRREPRTRGVTTDTDPGSVCPGVEEQG